MLFVEQEYISDSEKETFIKGLVLIELVDGVISPSETIFIYNRAKLLDVPLDIVDKFILSFHEINIEKELKSIKFSDQHKAVYFLTQAVMLGYQDGHYTEDEIQAMRVIAETNGIEKFTLSMIEALAKLEDSITLERNKILDSYL